MTASLSVAVLRSIRILSIFCMNGKLKEQAENCILKIIESIYFNIKPKRLKPVRKLCRHVESQRVCVCVCVRERER